MPKQIRASVCFELPADPREEAAALATIATAWQQFSVAAEASLGIKLWGQSFAIRNTRAPRPPRPRRLVEVA